MMSQILMQEAKAIGAKLSVTEKTLLIEWLSSQLRQELEGGHSQPTNSEQKGTNAPANGHAHPQEQRTHDVEDEAVTPWTVEEVRAMIKPEPKTGAEIAAMIESGQIDTRVGAELEISDVVTWLEDLRRQERIERGLEG
jgi:hypothetical protein